MAQQINWDKFVKDDQIVGREVISNCKMVGLFFGAYWCPPCRTFTPQLLDAYMSINGKQPNSIEIVYISSDRDKSAFTDYFETMPWLALPFEDTSRKDSLSEQFDVDGLPQLVILRNDGSEVTRYGRLDIIEHGSDAINKWN